MCIWLACLAVLGQPTLAETVAIEAGIPMKTIPMHLMPRSYAGRKRTLTKFQPKDSVGLRFVDAEKSMYYGACHHVDMNVELKTDDGNQTIQSLNPFAFQNAVKSFSCSGSPAQLHLELDPEFAMQTRRWNLSPSAVFAVIIPHDFVNLKKNKACFNDLSATAKKWTKDHPMETVVKLVKDPQILNTTNSNTLSMSVVKTDIWSQMNRAQSVKIYHRPLEQMIPYIFTKRSTAEQDGPMWDFEHDLTPATQSVAGDIPAQNVNANLDQSSVKGYAQADMSWKQTCIKNIFTGNMDCAKWGISSSKISGMTQVNHQAKVSVKCKTPSMLTLTNVSFTTPSFSLMAPIPLLGFSVPGVFDMGANVGLSGAATKDLLVNTGSTSSCPWIIDWNGSFTQIPTIQFGTCTLPGTPKFISDPGSILSVKSSSNSLFFGPDPASQPDVTLATMTADATGSRESAYVSVGMTVSPSLSLGLQVFGISALSAGISAPINLAVNSNWDTAQTSSCPANNVALNTDGSASLQLNGGFFGFSKSIPLVQGPTLSSTPA
ncbi:hypothetical protein BGZ58_006007 [Dissophora ornata]|nr:hypothetical protein BGZ58_006007 [Dissophora ornata]